MARISAAQFIDAVLDADSFRSWDPPPSQPDLGERYAGQLARARESSGREESILTGEGTLDGRRVSLIVGEFAFLAGSIGRAASERIVRAFERAAQRGLPMLASPISGGTRVQEGTHAFVQLVKIFHAVHAYKRTSLPYLVYLRDPTTGGPLISWGSLGHVTLAEPGALIGLLGPRVAETLTGTPMAQGVQQAEHLASHGVIDRVVAIGDLRTEAGEILHLLAPPRTIGAPQPGTALRGTPGPSASEPSAPDYGAPEPSALHRNASDRNAVSARPTEGGGRLAWGSVEATNAPGRPRPHDIAVRANSYVPLLGTGSQRYRGGVSVGLARFGDLSCVLIGHTRAALPGHVLTCEGMQRARRGFEIAKESNTPVVTIIDTPGIEISAEAEESGIAREVARTVDALVGTPVPVVSVILGAGTGVSALTLLPADRTICAQNAWVAPLPLDGASEILHRTAEYAPQLAEEQGIRAVDLVATGAVDAIVAEHPDAAAEPDGFSRRVVEAITAQLRDLHALSPPERLGARWRRYRRMY